MTTIRKDVHQLTCSRCKKRRSATVHRNAELPKPRRVVPPGWTEDAEGQRICPACTEES